MPVQLGSGSRWCSLPEVIANAIGLAASTDGNHLFGSIEAAGTIAVLTLGILGLSNDRWLGAAWLVHTGLDLAHHL